MAPSTLGTFLRTFTFGHVRQLDAVVSRLLANAWAAGAGPAEGEELVVDLDSTVAEVYGKTKQGASYGYTGVSGYHPLIATRAGTGEILGSRMRKGAAGSSRGVLRFIGELLATIGRAGVTGQVTVRADSAFWSWKLIDKLNKAGVGSVSYTHLRAHETVLDLVCRLLLEKKKGTREIPSIITDS